MLVFSIVFSALFQAIATLQENGTGAGGEELLNPRIIGPGDPTQPFSVHWYAGEPNKRLRCQVWGDPMPEITWYTDLGLHPGPPSSHVFNIAKMKKLPPALKDVAAGWSEVAFAKVHYNLEGNYYCYAKNDKGIANRLYNVVVDDPVDKATIIVGVTALVLILILISCLVFVGSTFVKHKRAMKHISKDEEKEFRDGDEKVMNATNDYIGSAQVLIQAQPYNPKYEIPREKIICYNNQVLGTGEFGIVVQGAVQDSEGRMIHAAVKTTRSNVDLDYFRALLSEVKIMSFIGKHPNVVNLIGACTANIGKNELLVAVEYCQKGNMRDFLRKNREKFVNLVADGILDPDRKEDSLDSISTIELIRWASEVARGMEFLASKNVIHADLAGRNILLTSNMVAKICDFGLSRQLVDYTNYVKKQQCPLPWKWMAIESLKDMHFSIHSDVWAYGVVLWELFTLGEVPYPGQNWSHDFLKGLIDGQRLPSPTYATRFIYETMRNCWDEDPRSRPSFLNLKQTFENMLADVAGRDYMDVIQGDYRELDQDYLSPKLEDYAETKLLKKEEPIEVPEELPKPSPEQQLEVCLGQIPLQDPQQLSFFPVLSSLNPSCMMSGPLHTPHCPGHSHVRPSYNPTGVMADPLQAPPRSGFFPVLPSFNPAGLMSRPFRAPWLRPYRPVATNDTGYGRGFRLRFGRGGRHGSPHEFSLH